MMLTFVKLGGSLITDKRVENSFRAEAAARVAAEIQSALAQNPDLRLLIGHGSGSFGHVAAQALRHDGRASTRRRNGAASRTSPPSPPNSIT